MDLSEPGTPNHYPKTTCFRFLALQGFGAGLTVYCHVLTARAHTPRDREMMEAHFDSLKRVKMFVFCPGTNTFMTRSTFLAQVFTGYLLYIYLRRNPP